MNAKAITGTYEQVISHYESLSDSKKIARNDIGEIFDIFQVNDSEMFTLVWMPVAQKTRRPPSFKKMRQDAAPYCWDVYSKDGAFVIEDRKGDIIATAKTQIGIRRKLTKMIEDLKIEQVRRSLEHASDVLRWEKIRQGMDSK